MRKCESSLISVLYQLRSLKSFLIRGNTHRTFTLSDGGVRGEVFVRLKRDVIGHREVGG